MGWVILGLGQGVRNIGAGDVAWKRGTGRTTAALFFSSEQNLLFQVKKALSDEMVVTDGSDPAAKKPRVEPGRSPRFRGHQGS